jgi:hypothetical protein
VLSPACAASQTVEGSAINSATGIGLAGVRVEFLHGAKTLYDATTDAQGHFTLEGVRDGTYSARYTCPDYWPSDPGTPGPFQANMGVSKQTFPMVFLSPHSGQIRDGFVALGPHAMPDADGSFSLETVYPGAYSINVGQPPPPSYYLDSVRVGEAEAVTREVELSSGAVPITVIYKTNGGNVLGTVEKCGSGRVALVPQDAAMRRPVFLRVALCNSNDRYEVMGVRPGEYYALAFAGDGDLPWNAILDGSLFSQAGRITVEAGEPPRPTYARSRGQRIEITF